MNLTKKKIYILFSVIFGICFSLKFISAFFINISLNGELNFPSNTVIDHLNVTHDMTMIFSLLKNSIMNQSIFELGTKLTEIEDKYTHYASRGIGLYLYGLFLNFFDQITSIAISYLIFSGLNCYLILKYFKNYKLLTSLFLFCLTILFSSKVFGGILNPLHYFEYLTRILEAIKENHNSLPIFYTSLFRAPNILINNVFIFINFFILKNFFFKQEILRNDYYYIFLLLFFNSFLDPIIFILYLGIFSLSIIYKFYFNKINKKELTIFIFILILLSSTIIFHFYNFELAFADNEKHGIGLKDFWTGNFIYSIEMLLIPILLYFFFNPKFKENHIFELLILITLFVLWIFLYFLFNEILASRITYRNFEILIGAISLNFLICFIKSLNLGKLKIIILLAILHLPFVYYLDYLNLFNYYVVFLILFFIGAYFFIKKKLFINQKILQFFSFIFPIIFLFLLSNNNLKHELEKKPSEQYQKKYFNSQKTVEPFITLNLGLILNSGYQKNVSEVFIYNITNVASSVKRKQILERLNLIFYLYGFDVEDLDKFLSNYITLWEIDKNNYSEHQLNLALLNKIIFYENYQNNYQKEEPINILLKSYEKFLLKELIEIKKNFQNCIITEYDKKYIKKNSFFYKISKKEPIYQNKYLKVFNCSKN
jgi:hypothetical protein